MDIEKKVKARPQTGIVKELIGFCEENSLKKTSFNCSECNKEKPIAYHLLLKKKREGIANLFCSRDCANESGRFFICCKQCDGIVARTLSQICENNNCFCSINCGAIHNNALRDQKDKIFCKNCGAPVLGKNAVAYCGKKCMGENKRNDAIEKWKNGNWQYAKSGDTPDWLRWYIFSKFNEKCTECGWSKVNQATGKIPLQVEHIDGNWQNNKEDNLTLLCPNCHSLTPTYGSLNKGHGRPYRYKLK